MNNEKLMKKEVNEKLTNEKLTNELKSAYEKVKSIGWFLEEVGVIDEDNGIHEINLSDSDRNWICYSMCVNSDKKNDMICFSPIVTVSNEDDKYVISYETIRFDDLMIIMSFFEVINNNRNMDTIDWLFETYISGDTGI